MPRELSPELSQALAALPAQQREAITLVCIEGLEVREAARRLGMHPDRCAGFLERGLARLRGLPEPSVAQLHEAIARLPERQMLAAVAVWLKGASTREAADAMGCSHVAVVALLARARLNVLAEVGASRGA